jgi:hypothetical protein
MMPCTATDIEQSQTISSLRKILREKLIQPPTAVSEAGAERILFKNNIGVGKLTGLL